MSGAATFARDATRPITARVVALARAPLPPGWR